MGMLDRLKSIFALRRTSEPKYPDERRVPYNGRSLAGVSVTPDNAVTVPAVWACVRYLSQTVAVLPWRVMRESAEGKVLASSHPVDWMIRKRPNPETSAFQFRETLTHWALLWGNGYAEIERDGAGRPVALWPIQPWRVCVERLDDGSLVYEVNNGAKDKSIIPAMDMFHIRGFGHGPVGVNVMEYAAESIGWARAAQLFGAAFFGNNMGFGGMVSVEGGLTEPGKIALEKTLNQKFNGPRNAWRWFVGDKKMELQPFGVEPNKGQFIETNQHLVEEVCRWFGVPPHKVAHLLRSTFNNIEHQAIEVVQDSVIPWVKRFEEEADYKLFGAQNRLGFYTKMSLNALLRGDAKSRGEYYQLLRNAGAVSADEIRELEDLNPIGPDQGGDIRIVQSQNVPLDQLREVTENQMEAAVMPKAPAPANASVDEIRATTDILSMARARVGADV
jgi:HK97 family phage portal protein